MLRKKYKPISNIQYLTSNIWGTPVPHRLPGFTLIELSIVMIIIGILTAAVFKGQDLLESARLQATLSEFNRIKLSLISYLDQFGYWPGNDPRAHQNFGASVQSGDGRGLVREREGAQVWGHLYKAGLADTGQAPTAKIGGSFSVKGSPHQGLAGNWIILSGSPGTLQPALTPKQAMQLKAKADEPAPDTGHLRVLEAEGVPHGSCLSGNAYNLDHKSPSCIVMMTF